MSLSRFLSFNKNVTNTIEVGMFLRNFYLQRLVNPSITFKYASPELKIRTRLPNGGF